jgi:helicase MOV-10
MLMALSNDIHDPIRFVLERVIASRAVRSASPIEFCITFTSSFRGRFQDRLEFIFEDHSLDQRFVIIRSIRGIAGERSDHELLQPTAPYVPRKWMPRAQEINIIPGIRPPALNAIPWVISLPDAFVPKNLSDAVSSGEVKDILERLKRSFLPVVFSSDTYGRHWKYLLWLEEIRME